MQTAGAAGSGALAVMVNNVAELELCDDGYADACGSCNADCSGSAG